VITVWRIPLDAATAPDTNAIAELSERERERSALFATDALRNRWLHAHVAMRRILAREVDVAPALIAYEEGPGGKPHLASPASTGVEHNLSDSGDLALLAVSRAGPVGVDVEYMRPQRELEAIARSHFAPEEQAALSALPDGERFAAFYRIWTRKEAFIKATGTGLAYGLARFAVTHTARDARLTRVAEGPPTAWSLRALAVPAGYEAALVSRAPALPHEERTWSGVTPGRRA
jgi:4'-phosphopantetheinyl transferase